MARSRSTSVDNNQYVTTKERLAQELAARMDVNPLEVLLMIAGDKYVDLYPHERETYDPFLGKHVPVELRAFAAKEAVKYLYPQLKSVEHSGKDEGGLRTYLQMPDDERQKKLRQLESALTVEPGVGPPVIEGEATERK
jgi:hypothetical protein